MPPSQFFKRKAKSEEVKQLREENPDMGMAEAAAVIESTPVYNQSGFDVFTTDGGRTFGVAEISYNPETGEAKVEEIFTITRLIALKYGTMKEGLSMLKKRKLK